MTIIKTFPMGTIGTNCYLVYDNQQKRGVLIDCDGNTDELYDYLDQNEVYLTHVLLTHGHADHIGAVEKVRRDFQVTVICAKAELSVLANPEHNYSSFMGGAFTITADRVVEDGDLIAIGFLTFKVIATPGHTKGSICFLIENSLFTGDTLFQGSCGRTDLPTGSFEVLKNSLQKLANLSENYDIYAGHGPASTLDIEKASNPYL